MRISIALILVAGGCATVGKGDSRQGGTVMKYTEGSAGGHANTYWFVTPAGSVVVDVPLTISETKKLKGAMVRPYRIYITAAKAERFGGLDEMRKPEVPAYTTPPVATEINERGVTRLAPFHRADPEDVPSHVNPPTPAVEERTHDMVGEVEVELLPLGPAESEASLALFLPKTGELIAGDVVAGGDHVDLTWGRSVVWQDRIAELKALEPKHVYPGHGNPGGPELLDQTLEYLKFFHDTVADHVKAGAPARISKADFEDVKKKMLARFAKLGRAELLDKSIPAEYAVQVAAQPPAAEPAAQPAAGAPSATPAPSTPAPAPAPAAKSSSSSSSAADELLNTVDNDKSGSKKKKKK